MNERSKQIRRDSIELMREYGGTHYGGSFSCVEILIALYDHVMTPDDIFIMSKGHGCWPYYVILREKGFDPKIEGHPHYDPANGIHATTGSLGHGLPFGIGIAWAKKLRSDPGRVFVLMGDGECEEGTTWESLMILNKLKLDNLKIIVDYNQIQGSDRLENILPIPFDLISDVMIDGHDIDSVVSCSNNRHYRFILANTIKGHGVSFMENTAKWHSAWLDDEMMAKALEELV